MMRILVMIMKWVTRLFLLGVFLVILCNLVVWYWGGDALYDSVETVPQNHCALVLGTSKYTTSGEINPYYKYRMEAAVALYEADKVSYIIVSGDNRYNNYNEPATMYRDLVKAGISKNAIVLDYAGFRTLDSVVRCQKVFGQDKFTIVSQAFHIRRALFVARCKGIDAVGFTAEGVSLKRGLKVNLREIAARVGVVLDILTNRQPYFLGEPIAIPPV